MQNVQRFGSYYLLKKIATGGMAELYKAKKSGEQGFEKMLAVKMILPHLSTNEEFISMFIDEAKVAALLNHQNVVQIYDLGKIEDSYCIVMEYVRGKDLRAALMKGAKAGKLLNIDLACHIISAVLSGLSHAHGKKDKGQELRIVHRDISPQNVLISYDGEVKIVDFGIAKAATQSSDTRVGVLKGKVSYMSPEQARGLALDMRSDIFSAGTVFYELLTGRRLFKGDTDLNTLEKVREAKVVPLPTELNDSVPRELEGILLRSLAQRPEDRFQTAEEMEEALRSFTKKAGYQGGGHELGRYMHSVFREEIEAEIKEEEGWDQTIVTDMEKTRVRKAPSVRPVPASAARTAAAHPRQARRGPSLLTIVLFLVFIVAAGAYSWLNFGPARGKYQLTLNSPVKVVQKTPPPPEAAAPQPAIAALEREPIPPAPEPPAPPKKPTPERRPVPQHEPEKADAEAPPAEAAPPVQQYGSFNIRSKPWLFVIIDGADRGTTPLAGLRLTAGIHEMVLANPKFGIRKEVRLRIEPDRTTSIIIDPKGSPAYKEIIR